MTGKRKTICTKKVVKSHHLSVKKEYVIVDTSLAHHFVVCLLV